MKKGIVMDVNDEYITMLTPEGEFIKARHSKSSYEIGEETTFFPINERISVPTAKPKFFQMKKVRYAVASSLVAILLLSLFIPLSSQNEVYAYMSIDINPSFEVGFDDELKVISVEPLNDEARKLLESIPDWKNATLEDITDTIIEKSKESGYLKNGKEVVITTVVSDSHKVQVDKELEKDIEELTVELEKEDIAVTAIASTVETRNAAKEKGVSTGKLLIQENKLPKPKKEKAASDEIEKPAEKQKTVEPAKEPSQNAKKNVQEHINQNVKENANEVREDLKQKKEEVKEKVQENIKNSNMPDHVREKLEKKFEQNNWKKNDKNNGRNDDKDNRGNGKNNRGKDRDDD
ncbi:anti-sigma factor domain-containing protein [Fredinandcohnia sp. 179-A 10B2 NHS]|uniref:anti-sigma factor domain-containing protein n=1 Tax=Fredinandcohnia sp. 179-A 10B2 NHS TaxID=3235176 RepID=UPI0039A0D88E